MMPSNYSSSKQKQKSQFPIQHFSTAMGPLNMPDGQVQAEKLLGQIPGWVWNQEPEPQAEEAEPDSQSLLVFIGLQKAARTLKERSKNSVEVVVVLLSFPCPVSVERALAGAVTEQITRASFSCPGF